MGDLDVLNLVDALVRGFASLEDAQEKALVRQMVCLCRGGRYTIG